MNTALSVAILHTRSYTAVLLHHWCWYRLWRFLYNACTSVAADEGLPFESFEFFAALFVGGRVEGSHTALSGAILVSRGGVAFL